MSQPTDSLIVIYADESRQLDATGLASQLNTETTPHIAEGILKAKDDIETRQSPPQYIAIDIGHRKEDVFEELSFLSQACDAHTKVVVVGAANDISFYRALIDQGATEYYPYPCDLKQIATALLKAPALRGGLSQNTDKHGFAVGFMSAASGDGASTVALNTAYLLANKFNHSVVLVDLDYQFGMIARHLDLQAPYGIRELLEHPDRGVDSALLNKMMVSYGNNLQIVAAPAELRKLPNVPSHQIVELLGVLRSQFDFVLFDIQHVWVDWIESLVGKLDHHMVVSQLWLRSLTHVTRIMACLGELGINNDRVSVAMNRSGSRFKEALSADDFERVSGLEIDFYLPNDTRTIVESENYGKTVIELGHSELGNSLEAIAGHLHSLHTGEPYDQGKSRKKKGLIGNWFQ